jgi:hypothetical protein
MNTALMVLQLLNAAEPGIASLVVLLRKKDGTIGVLTFLDEADAQLDKNLAQISEWMNAHPK